MKFIIKYDPYIFVKENLESSIKDIECPYTLYLYGEDIGCFRKRENAIAYAKKYKDRTMSEGYSEEIEV